MGAQAPFIFKKKRIKISFNNPLGHEIFQGVKMRAIVSKDLMAMGVFKKPGIDYDNCKENSVP
jgi:hypothetical protein